MESQSSTSTTSASITGLIIALGLTTLFWWPGVASSLLPEELLWRNVASQGVDWLFCLILVGIVLLWERRPLSSLGFQPLSKTNLAAGLGLGGFFMLGMVLWKLIESWIGPGTSIISSTDKAGEAYFAPAFYVWFAPFSLITASVCEEVIYRGYAMERVRTLTDQPWIIILLPHLAFSLMHLKDGWDHALMIAVIGLLFPLYFWKYRDLTMVIVAHFFIDLLAIIGHFVI